MSLPALPAGVWNLATVRAVEVMRSRQVILEAKLTASGDPDREADLTERAAVRHLLAAARPLGAALCEDDCIRTRTFDPDTRRLNIVARWRPATREVEFLGGPVHGTITTLEDIGAPLTVTIEPLKIVGPIVDGDGYKFTAHETIAIYVLAGWREAERRWIYATPVSA